MDRGVAEDAVSQPGLRVVITGGGVGEVRIRDELGTTLATCSGNCTVAATPGATLEVAAATPSVFAGLSGACTTSDVACNVVIGNARATVTATFTPLPGELWTRLPGDSPLQAAAFDAAGHLIVASSGALTKLSASGGVIWQLPLAACSVATGPHNTIYVETSSQVMRLAAGGATIWAQPLDPRAVGCGNEDTFDGFLHNLAVGSDGAVAIHGSAGVARWDGDGNLTWSTAIDSHGVFSVAIDPHGVVHAGVESVLGEVVDILRFAPDGTPLAPIEHAAPQPHGMMVIDPVGRLLITASGHSHTDALGRSVRIPDSDFAPNGICAASSDAGWLYEADDDTFFARDWTFNRIHADGTAASFSSAIRRLFFEDELGTNPHDIAGSLDGRIAIVGAFSGVTYQGGWIVMLGP